MAQPQQSEWQPPHANTIANSARGVFTQDDASRLSSYVPWRRDLTNSQQFQTVPDWSDPQWDGTYQRRVMKYDAYFELDMPAGRNSLLNTRPAIRTDDARQNPTKYAKRFGVAARGPNQQRDGWGHSRFTPTEPAFQTTPQPAIEDEYDKSLQTIMFDYTTSELVAQGAFNPDLAIAWPPNLTEPIHPIFSRNKWDQTNPPRHPSWWAGVFDVRYGSELNGVAGSYDAINNQQVWDVLEPALRLASRVLASNHPMWLAMTNIFHLRPVDASRDGRTPAQKTAQGGTNYVSLWLDENDPRIPAPYPEMQNLRNMGFDDNAARTACLEILQNNLRFKISSYYGYLGITHCYTDAAGNFCLVIYIGASLIWPLLTSTISDSERAACTFKLVATILHEVGHACRQTLISMTVLAPLWRATPTFGPTSLTPLTVGQWHSLNQLGEEIWGPVILDQNGLIMGRVATTLNFFFEEDLQGEDGFNVEKQLWGGLIKSQSGSEPTFSWVPVLNLTPYPTIHPQPLQQGRTLPNQEGSVYQRFLTDSRANSWEQFVALPVEWLARYFQEDWWQSEFPKFQASGLKLSTNDPALPQRLMRSTQTIDYIWDNEEDIKFIFGESDYDWLVSVLDEGLQRQGLDILSAYLRAQITQAAIAKILRTRIDNESAAWQPKLDGLTNATRNVFTAYQTMVTTIGQRLILPTAPVFRRDNAAAVITEMSDALRLVVGPIVELSRLFSQEVAYQQDILCRYMQLDQQLRATFHQDMLLWLRTMTGPIRNLLNRDQVLANSPYTLAQPSPRITGSDPNGDLNQRLHQKVMRDLQGGNPAGATGNLPQDIRDAGNEFLGLFIELVKVHQTFHNLVLLLDEIDSMTTGIPADGSLQNVQYPNLQALAQIRRQGPVQSYLPAALRELTELQDPAMGALLAEGFDILSRNMDPSLLSPLTAALQPVQTRNATRQNLLRQGWHYYLMTEVQSFRTRRAQRLAGRGGVAPDRTGPELMARMAADARGNVTDLALLASLYTEADVVGMVNGSIPLRVPWG